MHFLDLQRLYVFRTAGVPTELNSLTLTHSISQTLNLAGNSRFIALSRRGCNNRGGGFDRTPLRTYKTYFFSLLISCCYSVPFNKGWSHNHRASCSSLKSFENVCGGASV